MEQQLSDWKIATGNLPYGVQNVLMDTLGLVKDEKIHLVYGSNYRQGKPCLFNAVSSMIMENRSEGDTGLPSTDFQFHQVVGAFDEVNRILREQGINESGYVSPLAAEILIRNFGTVKGEPDPETLTVAEESHGRYIEPSDEELAKDWLKSMEAPGPEEVKRLAEEGNDVARFANDYIFGQSN